MIPFKKLITSIARFIFKKAAIPQPHESMPPGAKEPELTSPQTSYLQSALPPYPVIWVYFAANHYPEAEALRFYRRYQLLGWNKRIVPIIDNWQELADHWMQHTSQSPHPKTTNPPPDAHSPGSDSSNTEPA